MSDGLTPGCRLSGRRVFMSASVPAPDRAEEFRRVPDAALEIEQAVVSLARAVLSEGGTLVFGGHPSISPLVGMVAGEYRPAHGAAGGQTAPEPQLIIYQSSLFHGHAPEDTLLMFRLGLAEVRWVDQDPGETFDGPSGPGPRYPKSLARMRRAMIGDTRPVCMVGIGGMEGVIDEAELFAELRPGRPRFLLRRTGGAAAMLAEKGAAGYVVIDDVIMAEMQEMDSRSPPPVAAIVAPDAVPYPLIMQSIVDKIARSSDS